MFFSHSQAIASNSRCQSKAYQNYLQGLMLDEQGEYKQAIKAYSNVIKFDSQAKDVHYRLAIAFMHVGDFKGAQKELSLVLNKEPYNEKALIFLALSCSYQNKFKKAIAAYKKLLSHPLLELRAGDIHYFLAQVYLAQRDLSKAHEEFKSILKDNPLDAAAYFYLGYVYSENGQEELAIEEWAKAIEIDPENSLSLNSLSYVYARKGQNLDDALVLAQKALELDPSNGAYLDTLGWVYFKKGDLDKALKYLNNASVLLEDSEIFEHLGDVYAQKGDSALAQKNWKKALQMAPAKKYLKNKIKDLKIKCE